MADDLEDDPDGGNPFADVSSTYVKRQTAKGWMGGNTKPVEPRRTRGRPPGAMNRKTKDFDNYFQKMGFTDPLTAMAQFITEDPVELFHWICEHEPDPKKRPGLWDVLKDRMAVASHLAPYLHGKKPVQLEIIDERLPHLVIELGTNQLDEARRLQHDKVLSLGKLIEGELDDDGPTIIPNENSEIDDEPE